MDPKDIEYLEARLHSPEMKCRQCEITRALILEAAADG